VGLASSCEQALDMAAELHPDLVLIGYSTPVMGGIEVTRRLIEADPGTLVLLIGAMAGPERTARALQSGAMGYVLLETPPQELASQLRCLVRGKDTKPA
jgi:DNA-binding NarL/FixJ family response regulator